jgi:hypothetical protein
LSAAKTHQRLRRGQSLDGKLPAQLIPGASYFFTVNLADRRLRLLTDHIGSLRAAFREVRARHLSRSTQSSFCPIICMPSGPCPEPTRISHCGGA